jgi:peptidoglycan hydrolase CwlO-like protein
MDVEKTMQFIIDVQAKLEASAQQHYESLAELRALGKGHEARIAKLETSVATVTDLVGRLAQAEIRFTDETRAGFKELRDIQATTEYKLNALIDTVDKLTRRNGHKE